MPDSARINMSDAWTDAGYILKNLDFKKQKAVFYIKDSGLSELEIPDSLLKKRIPRDAKYELENYMKYVIKKYSL